MHAPHRAVLEKLRGVQLLCHQKVPAATCRHAGCTHVALTQSGGGRLNMQRKYSWPGTRCVWSHSNITSLSVSGQTPLQGVGANILRADGGGTAPWALLPDQLRPQTLSTYRLMHKTITSNMPSCMPAPCQFSHAPGDECRVLRSCVRSNVRTTPLCTHALHHVVLCMQQEHVRMRELLPMPLNKLHSSVETHA